jgi:hypothetical protein
MTDNRGIQNNKSKQKANQKNTPKSKNPISRRDVLKSLATVHVLGALAYEVHRK